MSKNKLKPEYFTSQTFRKSSNPKSNEATWRNIKLPSPEQCFIYQNLRSFWPGDLQGWPYATFHFDSNDLWPWYVWPWPQLQSKKETWNHVIDLVTLTFDRWHQPPESPRGYPMFGLGPNLGTIWRVIHDMIFSYTFGLVTTLWLQTE